MLTQLKYLLFTISLVLLAAATGCSGCEDDCPNGCAEGELCVDGQCNTAGRACGSGCPTGQECFSNQCVVTSDQCSEVREECDSLREVNDGFICLDFDGAGPAAGECLKNCEADNSCDAGSLCFFVEGPFDGSCAQDSDCADGLLCRFGACRDTVCRLSECDGFLADDATCQAQYGAVPGFESGAICGDLANDASFCFPAGPGQLGDTCTGFTDNVATGDFSQGCAPGLGCVDGNCVTACSDDDGCAGTDSCLLVDRDLLGRGVGFCGQGCTPFTADCGDSGSCLPVEAGEGICVDSGPIALFEACVPGEGQCEAGTFCVQLQAGNTANGLPTQARCLPICDVTVGEGNPDGGAVGDLEQSLRDATCPNADPPPATLTFVNFSTANVDIYFGTDPVPPIAALSPGARADADQVAAGEQYFELPSGNFTFRVLPAGAPRTDAPLLDATASLVSGESREVRLIAAPGADDEITQSSTTVQTAPISMGQAQALWVHSAADISGVDVIAVPAGDDLSDPANQTELLVNSLFQSEAWIQIPPAQSLDILVFPTGSARDSRIAVLASLDAITLQDGDASLVSLIGTADLIDTAALSVVQAAYLQPQPASFTGALFTCVDLNNGVYGYCQQSCGTGPEPFGQNDCLGLGMGCVPTLVSGPEQWRNMCGPLGPEAEGEPCNPFAQYGECGQGLYCQEFGATAPGFDPANRGFCNALCVEGDPANSVLTCGAGESCKPLDFVGEYAIGLCAVECNANANYSDPMCPEGLQACLPTARLFDDDASGGTAPPRAEAVQSFCSVSGDVAQGETCTGSDCVPGTECLYPRAIQFDFVSTLFSAYVGGPGLEPTCTPQCDPFDGDTAPQTCGANETCLFNFPVNAEVGHCAEITEPHTPGDPCSNPGQACGEDSICILNGDAPVCFQFCEYVSGDPMGMFRAETCSAGFVCAPLENDVGVCLQP